MTCILSGPSIYRTRTWHVTQFHFPPPPLFSFTMNHIGIACRPKLFHYTWPKVINSWQLVISCMMTSWQSTQRSWAYNPAAQNWIRSCPEILNDGNISQLILNSQCLRTEGSTRCRVLKMRTWKLETQIGALFYIPFLGYSVGESIFHWQWGNALSLVFHSM